MYLIAPKSPGESRWLIQKTSGGYGVLKPNPKYSPPSKHERGDFEGPEADATQGIEKLQEQFRSDLSLSSVDYLVGSSGLREHDYDYILRDIGGATAKARERQSRLKESRGDEPILDGLAQNLIRKLFWEYYGPGYQSNTVRTGAKAFLRIKPGDNIFLDTMLDSLNRRDSWLEESNIPRGGWKQQTFFALGVSGKPIELAFLAEEDSQGNFTLRSVRTKYRSSVAYLEGVTDGDFMLRSHLNDIIQDHQRRTELARLYSEAPRVSGFPAPLRAALKAGLEAMGIPNGSYSRLGFSSGRFPYAQVRTRVQSWRRSEDDSSDPVLLFERCPWCGIVCRLKVEGVDRLQEPMGRLSEELIEPWHSSICEERTARFDSQLKGVAEPPLVRRLIPSAAGTGGLV